MTSHANSPKQCVAAFILALGLAVAWGFAGAWLVMAMYLTDQATTKILYFNVEGEPVIATTTRMSTPTQTYRMPDGKEIANQGLEFLDNTYLQPWTRLNRMPIDWSSRILATSDGLEKPTAWYLLRDGRSDGHAYLIGYDPISKLRVGYIGRDGFQRSIPTLDQQFAVGYRRFHLATGAFAMVDANGFSDPPAPSLANMRALSRVQPKWKIYLIDGDQLREIDLANRSVRTVYEASKMKTVNTHHILIPAKRPPDEPEIKRIASRGDDGKEHQSLVVTPDYQAVARLAVRTADQIILLDPITGSQQSYTLPEASRDAGINIYSPLDKQLIVQWTSQLKDNKVTAVWISPDDKVVRQENIQIMNYQGLDSSAIPAVVAPIPLAWLVGIFVLGPLSEMDRNPAITYGVAVNHAFETVGVAFFVLLLLGAVLVAWTYRLQKKYHRSMTPMWCIFVFFLGVPGFLAYWFEHRRPKLESCRKCSHVVPRDRDACADCHAPFPAPPLLGTEIFA